MLVFVRRNRNRSGSVSVQIVTKTRGKTKIIKTVGVSKYPIKINHLSQKAKVLIPEISGQANLLPLSATETAIENFVAGLTSTQVRVVGPEIVFGTIFDAIGFDQIKSKDCLFRHLVITRLVYPGSKLKTIDYLQRYQGLSISVDRLYRFLDKLNSHYQQAVEQIAFNYTKKALKGKISVVFYDMTTLYFEAEREDEGEGALRKIGFSKDGKFQKPQIMLGLLVGEKGLPIGYDIFEGNTFEGHTLLPTLESIQKKYGFGKPIVVADAALLSKDNLEALKQAGYCFIIGGRIKNETEKIKARILEQSREISDGDNFIIRKPNRTRLLITYSDKRARKDSHNRERGLKKLRKRIKTDKLTKENINNRGYNKFLELKGEMKVTINEEKINQDKRWDGLKGYVTNSKLGPKKIIHNYTQLWQIEKAFRISKTDLKVRPIYHRLKDRIGAHICIAFVAYTVYKELERLLYKYKAPFSVKRAGELTHTIYELQYVLPESLKEKRRLLKVNQEQQALLDIIRVEKI